MTLPKFSLWPIFWVVLLATGWLLPNHYPPWTSFHLDAWIATVALLAAIALVSAAPGRSGVYGMALVVLALTAIPGVQYQFGLVTSAGNAWVSTAYLLGLLLAILTGARWEAFRPGQMLDLLFIAIGIAAILSVGLQFHQWLGLGRLEFSTMGNGQGRPFANFGQPNQLATFLLWALVALLWGIVRRKVGGRVAIVASLYLLFGVALTASRTAWVGLAWLLVLIWVWRRQWPYRKLPWVATWLAAYFVLCVVSVRPVTEFILGGLLVDHGDTARLTSDSRLDIWAMFLDAARLHPWLGFGWNQSALAQSSVSDWHRPFHSFFPSTHNLVLDLVIWCGAPLGLAIAAWACWWCWQRARRVDHAENVVLALFLVVVGNHAMFELPLHHAYFLLPVGLVVGSADVRLAGRPVFIVGRAGLALVCLAAACLLGLIIRDYTRVEPVYETLRYEWANIKTAPAQPPDVVLLTQWVDFVQLVKFEPRAGLTDAELQWMRQVVPLYPSSGFFMKIARTLALNGRPDEAALWLNRMCPVVALAQCELVKRVWVEQAASDTAMASVPWPR